MYLFSPSHGHGGVRLLGIGSSGVAHGVDAAHEVVALAEHVQDLRPDAGHQCACSRPRTASPSPCTPILAMGDPDRSHAEYGMTNIVRPCHASVDRVRAGAFVFISSGSAPVVRGAGVLLVLRGADERAVLDTRHVGGIRADEIAAGALGLVQLHRGTAREHQLDHFFALARGAVAPLHVGRFTKRAEFLDPVEETLILGRRQWMVPDCERPPPVCRVSPSSRERGGAEGPGRYPTG